MSAYYNEIDPYAAEWLRNLIKAGHIAPGDVDSRSIADVRPSDLAGYTQCHFFAGIGVWSYALRLAGWPDDRPVWTGSCPCQPFSVAGKGKGGADDRHLWPVWFNLIRECQPSVVFGEQVESAIRHGWLDLVQADMEGVGYAFGAVGIPAAGFGAPHIRQRLWFVADTAEWRSDVARRDFGNGRAARWNKGDCESGAGSADGILAHPTPGGLGINGSAPGSTGHAALGDAVGLLGDAERAGLEGLTGHGDGIGGSFEAGSVAAAGASGPLADTSDGLIPQQGRGSQGRNGSGSAGADDPVPGDAGESLWSACEWIRCRDGKWRPVEPGTFPLAHGVAGRVGRLRAYGNAIVPQVAAEVIGAYMDTEVPA